MDNFSYILLKMGMVLNYLWLDDWHIVVPLFPFSFFSDDDEMVYSLKKQSRKQNREGTKIKMIPPSSKKQNWHIVGN